MSKKTLTNIQTTPVGSGASIYYESAAFKHLDLIKAVTLKNKTTILVHRGGGVSKVYRMNGINQQAFSDHQFKSLFDGLEMAINSLPENKVHMTFTTVKKPANFTAYTELPAPYYLKSRMNLVAEMCKNRKVFFYEFYLTLFAPGEDRSTLQKTFSYISSKFGGGKNLFEKTASADFYGVDDRISLISEAEDNVLPTMSTLGLKCVQLKTETEYYDHIQEFTRPQTSQHIGKMKVDAFRESPRKTLFSGMNIDPFYNYFVLDDTYHKVFSMTKAPQEDISPSDICKVLSVQQEMILSVTIQKLDKEQRQKRVGNAMWNRRMELSKSKGKEDYFANSELVRVENEIQRLADGQSFGAAVSVNLAVRIPKSHIDTESHRMNIKHAEYIRRVTSQIKKNGFQEFGKSDWNEEREGSVPTYFRMIPGMSHLSSYHMKSIFLAGIDVPYFLPIYDTSVPKGFNGMNGWIDDQDALYTFDALNEDLKAWNYYIIGQTGSGKSFIINSILANEYGTYFINKEKNPDAKKPVICIMDEGGGDANSFIKQVDILGGVSIPLGGAKKPHISLLALRADHAKPTPNKMSQLVESLLPTIQAGRKEIETMLLSYYATAADKDFSTYPRHLYDQEFENIFGIAPFPGSDELLQLLPGEVEPNTEQMRKIVSTIEIMLAPSNEALNTFSQGEFREDQIRKLIRETYQITEGRFPQLSDTVELAKAKRDAGENPRLFAEYIDRMASWCRDGDFPNFDLDSDVDLTSDLIMVDFKGIGKEKKLKAIYTLLFMGLFEEKMLRQKSQRRLFIVDEAWSMLANQEARNVYIEFLRTARKHKFGTMSSTQTVAEYVKDDREMGLAALGQMQVGIIGRQDEKVLEVTQDILKLSDEITEILPTLGAKKEDGVFKPARFLIQSELGSYLLKNEVDPNEYWVYTSDGDDNFVIDYFNKRGDFMDKEEICRFMALKKADGDEGLIQHLRNSGKLDLAKRYSANKKGLPF